MSSQSNSGSIITAKSSYCIDISTGKTVDKKDAKLTNNTVAIDENGKIIKYKFSFKYGIVGVTETEHGDFFDVPLKGRLVWTNFEQGKPYISFCDVELPWEENDMAKITEISLGKYIDMPFTLHPSVSEQLIDGAPINPAISKAPNYDPNDIKPITPYKGWFPTYNATIQQGAFSNWSQWHSVAGGWIATDMTNLYVSPIKYDYERKILRIYSEVEVTVEFLRPHGQSGVDDIEVDDEAVTVAYYDMLGREVANPVKGRLYIKAATTKSGKRSMDKVLY